jgi:hypothetical protein
MRRSGCTSVRQRTPAQKAQTRRSRATTNDAIKRCDAEHQTRGGDDSVIRTQNGRAQPPNAATAVSLQISTPPRHNRLGFSLHVTPPLAASQGSKSVR